jgi:hypothetical protein
MLRYRAAAWWANVYCPEIALGLMTQEEALDIEPVSVREAPTATLPTSSLDQPTPEATDAKQGPAIPELLSHRKGSDPLESPLNPEAHAPLIRSEPAAGEAALPAAVVEAEIVDSGHNQPEPAPASRATPAATRRSRNQGTSAAGTTAANTPESPPSEQDPAPVGSQEPVEASPTPAATPGVDPVEAGLQQIPRIATLLELDTAYGRVNQLLGSGRITDSAAERLWSAVARRRKELEGETP